VGIFVNKAPPKGRAPADKKSAQAAQQTLSRA